MSKPLAALLGFIAAAFVVAVTSLLIAVVMVAFSIASTPDWSLGVVVAWGIVVGVATGSYLRRHVEL